ncbi:MAG: tryptophan--tRNA ligase [Candidatus Komeilibacteria bacterium]
MTTKKIVLTGDRPTGKLHLGHYVGSLKQRLELQKTLEQFVMIADVQALTDNFDNPQKVHDNVLQVALDYLAVGIDPSATTIFVQSQIPEISELALYFMNLVTVSRLQRNPTVKAEMKEKGFAGNVPAGFLVYPISQAADILCVRANLVPVGEDQYPMIEQTNEIVRRFNSLYGEIFGEVEAGKAEISRLPGLDGKAKMSKSLGNCIYLSDSRKDLESKVMKMYTDPNHVKAEDPGRVEGNVVFTYLQAFAADQAEVKELEKMYQKGGLGDVVLKRKLIEVLDQILSPIRLSRATWEKNPDRVMKILQDGTEKTRVRVAETLRLVRQAMKINYFI